MVAEGKLKMVKYQGAEYIVPVLATIQFLGLDKFAISEPPMPTPKKPELLITDSEPKAIQEQERELTSASKEPSAAPTAEKPKPATLKPKLQKKITPPKRKKKLTPPLIATERPVAANDIKAIPSIKPELALTSEQEHELRTLASAANELLPVLPQKSRTQDANEKFRKIHEDAIAMEVTQLTDKLKRAIETARIAIKNQSERKTELRLAIRELVLTTYQLAVKAASINEIKLLEQAALASQTATRTITQTIDDPRQTLKKAIKDANATIDQADKLARELELLTTEAHSQNPNLVQNLLKLIRSKSK